MIHICRKYGDQGYTLISGSHWSMVSLIVIGINKVIFYLLELASLHCVGTRGQGNQIGENITMANVAEPILNPHNRTM